MNADDADKRDMDNIFHLRHLRSSAAKFCACQPYERSFETHKIGQGQVVVDLNGLGGVTKEP